MAKIVFMKPAKSIEEFRQLSQAAMSSPADTAAMTMLALSLYPENKEQALQMLDFLRGPRPMNGMDKQFVADRFRGKDYVPRSYFDGATPDNEYAPALPYSIQVTENPYSYANSGYAKLFIKSGGADDPRPITLRNAKDGKWYLWEYSSILLGIREPASANPWA